MARDTQRTSGMSTLPGKVEKPPGPLKAHEVVSEVEVGDILAVKEIFRHCFQTVAGEVHHADRLRHHLQTTVVDETSGLVSDCESIVTSDSFYSESAHFVSW